MGSTMANRLGSEAVNQNLAKERPPMVCKVADNPPLQVLRRRLGLPSQCHSLREQCAQGYYRQLGAFTMGGSGAAIGYCQALFNRVGPPGQHTRTVTDVLMSINAPWSKSHELFWGYRNNEPASEFLNQAIGPLAGSGRVPILITGLDPSSDPDMISEILSSSPAIFPGESILIRVVLRSEDSIEQAASLIKSLLNRAFETGRMPLWWPLLQADFKRHQWQKLKELLEDAWEYVNIAVNPFADPDSISEIFEQITVVQFVVGLSDGVGQNGVIQLPPEMKILGAAQNASYDIFSYASEMQDLPNLPICIILGPSAPTWTQQQNCDRLANYLSVFKEATEILWSRMNRDDRKLVWELSA